MYTYICISYIYIFLIYIYISYKISFIYICAYMCGVKSVRVYTVAVAVFPVSHFLLF